MQDRDHRSRRRRAAGFLFLPILACASSRGFLDSDVAEIPRLQHVRAQHVMLESNQLITGDLFYAGEANSVSELVHEFCARMTSLGWEVRTTDIGANPARASFAKDDRLCEASFRGGGGESRHVEASVRVRRKNG